MLSSPFSIYRNAMEPLAAQEIERQMQSLPEDIIKSINKGEAIAYALNRLPPLYATTQEGWHWQHQRAKETLQPLISKAASWAIRAVQRKPSKFSTPLSANSTFEVA
ncbi:MAG TPA: hypothetical protein DCL61_24235 [Cyanobacteria bacterium UBA12227]|nr:hypothetical protein [Cyanobacteria bacterium UBA12227]HAX84811.1 hypothetical protein [Cyanobacteria bacterium UBA11370]